MKRTGRLAYAIIPAILTLAFAPLFYFAYFKSPGNFFLPPEEQAVITAAFTEAPALKEEIVATSAGPNP